MAKYERTETTVNHSTGEFNVKKTEFKTRRLTEDDFSFMFHPALDELIGKVNGQEWNVLFLIIIQCKYENVVTIGRVERREIMKRLNIAGCTLSTYMKRLKTLGIIEEKDGRIIINSNLFWRGDLKIRNRIVKEKAKLKPNINFDKSED